MIGKENHPNWGSAANAFRTKIKKQASILLHQSKQQLKEYLLLQAANEMGFLNTLYEMTTNAWM